MAGQGFANNPGQVGALHGHRSLGSHERVDTAGLVTERDKVALGEDFLADSRGGAQNLANGVCFAFMVEVPQADKQVLATLRGGFGNVRGDLVVDKPLE